MSDFQPKPFGKYFLIEKLATGGMAEIYKAKTFGVDGFEKLLAIKRILPHCVSDKEFITMLIDEAKLSVLLSHTNIAQVFDLGKVGDDYFISMEFVDGINLRELMNRCKEVEETFPEDIAVYIVSEICKGLDYAHSKRDMDGNPLNIVHRDISPQNILISFEGEAKIVDFGIAKAAMNMSHTMAGILKGKITYMSPEQALGKPVDYKTDIFSIGLILYELLTGQKLFTGETQFEVLKKIRSTRITENSFPENISPNMKKILAKALAYSAKDRFENAGDMQLELTKYLYSTYLDFSPRKLANFMKRLFANEIQSKKNKRKSDSELDAQTRSFLLENEQQQNIVHRNDNEKTRIDQAGHSTKSFMDSFLTGEATAENAGTQSTHIELTNSKAKIAMPGAAPGEVVTGQMKAPKSWNWLYALILLAILGAGGYFGYKKFLQAPQVQGEKIGTISVNSVPTGAKIFLNDKDTGLLSPANLQNVELNFSQKITLKKERFREWTRLVTLISPQPLNVDANLEAIPAGTISIVSHPPGAKVYLDGQEIASPTPTQIPDLELNKTYTLKLEKEDYVPSEERITVYSVEPIKYEKKLEEIRYGSAEVRSTPPGAKIFVNNQDTGLITPNKVGKLEVGKSFTIRLSKDKYRDVSSTFTVTSEKPLQVSERMLSEEEIKKKEEEDKKKQQEKLKAEEEKKKLEEQRKASGQLSAEEQKKLLEEQRKKEEEARKAEQQKGGEDAKKAEEAKKKAEEDARRKAEEEARKKAEEKGGQASGPAFVSVSSSPPGADVFINGERKGSTPGKFQVSAGSAEVVISKTGAGRVTKVVSLKAGETKSLGTIELGAEFGSLRIESNPPGASVTVDGQNTGRKTPLIIKGVRRGKEHSVRLELDGYQSWSSSFNMDDDSKAFNVNLKQK